MKPIEVTGVDKVVRNLAKYRRNVGQSLPAAFILAAEFVMSESLPIVPFQVGDLKGSWDIRVHGSGMNVDVEFGYFGVEYAAYVHEIPHSVHAHGKDFNVKHAAEIAAARGTWRGTAQGGMFLRKPEEQWKFLEAPIRNNKKGILNIISNVIKRKIKI